MNNEMIEKLCEITQLLAKLNLYQIASEFYTTVQKRHFLKISITMATYVSFTS